jgi:hypothetical protein
MPEARDELRKNIIVTSYAAQQSNPDKEATVTAAARCFYRHTADCAFLTYSSTRPSSTTHVCNTCAADRFET